jgi:RNA polymerase sigma-70 factor (ECF subfamily)
MKRVPDAPAAAGGIDGLLARMRPKLHRYCSRMVGSVIDGEDVLQDALIKAVESHATAGAIGNPEGWLFRIAHAQHRPGFPAPTQPPGSAAIGRGGGHDSRPG